MKPIAIEKKVSQNNKFQGRFIVFKFILKLKKYWMSGFQPDKNKTSGFQPKWM